MKNWQATIIIFLGALSMAGAFLLGASRNHQHLFTGLTLAPLMLGIWLAFKFLAEGDKRISNQSISSPPAVSMIYSCPFCHKDIIKEPYIKIDSFVRVHRDCIEEEVKNSRIVELAGLE